MHRVCWIPSIRPWVFWCSAVFRRCSSSVGLQLSTLCVHSDAAWCSDSQHRGGRFRPAQSDAPSAHATVQQTGHRHRRAQHPHLSDAHAHCTAAGEPYNPPSTHCRYLLNSIHIRIWNYWACFSLLTKFVGYNDDILDVKFLGKDDTHIVVATNSSQLKVFELATNSCQILYGHTGEWATRGRQHCGYVTLTTHHRNTSVIKFGCNENTFEQWSKISRKHAWLKLT